MTLTPEGWRRLRDMQAELDNLFDEHTRKIVHAYVEAWDDVDSHVTAVVNELVAAAQDGRVTPGMVRRSQRAQAALRLMADKLHAASGVCTQTVAADVQRIVRAAVAANDAIINASLPAGFNPATGDVNLGGVFTRVDPRQVDAIIQRSTERITALSLPMAEATTAAVKRELVRGVLVGDNPRATAARMVRGVQGAFEGGITRALTIARTETLDAHRVAALESRKANADVLDGWEWVASLTSRTCPACWAMHGSVHKVDEPGPEGHPNCRCVAVPRTKSWRDLGFNIDEPRSLVPDADKAFAQLTASQQRKVLGPQRYAAFIRGEYPLASWAVRRSNGGWRDSYVPAPAPQGAAPRTPRRHIAQRPQPNTIPVPPLAMPPAPPAPIEFGRALDPSTVPAFVAAKDPRYYADPNERASAFLQAWFESEKLVKAAARNIEAGTHALDGLDVASIGQYLVTPGYDLTDFAKDIEASARTMLSWPDVPLGDVHKGLNLQGVAKPADVTALVHEDLAFSSVTPLEDVARRYAGNGTGSEVVLHLTGARGKVIPPVGGWASMREYLASGKIVVTSKPRRLRGVIHVDARFV